MTRRLSRPPPPAPRPLIITIDGPAAAGKSTAARLLAKRLGYLYVDTGAMYRALTWKALTYGVPTDDERALMRLAARTTIDLRRTRRGALQVQLDGRDVTQEIRTPPVDAAVSMVSAHPRVRRWMVARQRALGRRGGIVIEGRDTGSVVFPRAPVQFFLEADLTERARRRRHDLVSHGCAQPLTAVKTDLGRRDRRDRTRAASPLITPRRAIVINNTHLAARQVVHRMLQVIRQR